MGDFLDRTGKRQEWVNSGYDKQLVFDWIKETASQSIVWIYIRS